MSVGGIFNLIVNGGMQDELLLKTSDLLRRLEYIKLEKLRLMRIKYPNLDDEKIRIAIMNWSPVLSELEQSHTIFINGTYKPYAAMAHEYSKTTPQGISAQKGGLPQLGSKFHFSFPIFGEFINDAILHIKLSGLAAVNPVDKVRYYEFLGHRLMKNVAFKVSNNIMDSYTSDNYSIYYQYKVSPGKQQGYLKNIGQEIPYLGYLTADPETDEYREYRWFGNGPQTFKSTHEDVEMFIPMLFWFKEMQCSLPNFILPRGQTNIEIQLEEAVNLIAFANYGGGGAYVKPEVSECSLILNHLFVLPQLHQIFMSRFSMQLIRIHKVHKETLIIPNQAILLDQLKFPIENIFIGFRPMSNLGNSEAWCKNAIITDVNVPEAVIAASTVVQNNAVYQDEKQVVASLSLSAQGNVLYQNFPVNFYNNYLPFRYGNLNTPDLGWLMLNFNLYPGEYQPSGHINVSLVREFYLHYDSAVNPTTKAPYISSANPTELLVHAEAINFVLYDKNSMILRFAV
jgi:hypothetical protein